MTGIILLAAGESRRLGQPKQLVYWKGRTLIRHAAEVALSASLGPVVVVLGAVVDPCRAELEGLDVRIVDHPDWEGGMGGSIAAGMEELFPAELENVIVMLCDQPLIGPQHLQQLLSKKRPDCEIMASEQNGVPGPPVLFSKRHFPELLKLSGQDGARSILRRETSVGTIPCPEAATDIDTPEDLP